MTAARCSGRAPVEGPFATVEAGGRPAIVPGMTRDIDRPATLGPTPAIPTPELSADGRRTLMAWARACLEAAVLHCEPPAVDVRSLPPELRASGAAFVTITELGELRGCMGRLDEEAPIWDNIASAAAMAATRDPRFSPVRPSELPALHLEVSVLAPAVDIPGPEEFDPLRHGIIAQRGLRRGLLLPQVAREQGWGREETLDAVCWKAGLEPDAWRERGTRLQVFTATVFGEGELAEPDSTRGTDPA